MDLKIIFERSFQDIFRQQKLSWLSIIEMNMGLIEW